LIIFITWVLLRAKKTSRWSATKVFFTKIDLLFPQRHKNDVPGFMIERQTVLGGLFTILVPFLLIVIAVVLLAQWQNSPVIKSNALAYGLAGRVVASGRFIITTKFFGYNGVTSPLGCSTAYADSTFATGFTFSDSRYPQVTAVLSQFSCDITRDSGPDAVRTMGVTLGVKQPGYAAFISWTVP
jgi:hypothetical protein